MRSSRLLVCIAHQPRDFLLGLFTRFFKILSSIAAYRSGPARENLTGAACGIVVLVAFTLGPAHAQTVLHAGPDKVSLVELYTSEGCSSCPPAESWLSALNHDSHL